MNGFLKYGAAGSLECAIHGSPDPCVGCKEEREEARSQEFHAARMASLKVPVAVNRELNEALAELAQIKAERDAALAREKERADRAEETALNDYCAAKNKFVADLNAMFERAEVAEREAAELRAEVEKWKRYLKCCPDRPDCGDLYRALRDRIAQLEDAVLQLQSLALPTSEEYELAEAALSPSSAPQWREEIERAAFEKAALQCSTKCNEGCEARIDALASGPAQTKTGGNTNEGLPSEGEAERQSRAILGRGALRREGAHGRSGADTSAGKGEAERLPQVPAAGSDIAGSADERPPLANGPAQPQAVVTASGGLVVDEPTGIEDWSSGPAQPTGETPKEHFEQCGPFCPHVDICAACSDVSWICAEHVGNPADSFSWRPTKKDGEKP